MRLDLDMRHDIGKTMVMLGAIGAVVALGATGTLSSDATSGAISSIVGYLFGRMRWNGNGKPGV